MADDRANGSIEPRFRPTFPIGLIHEAAPAGSLSIYRTDVRHRRSIFRAPGDPYWDERTLRKVGLGYPHVDMARYRAAFGARQFGAGQ